MKIIELPMPGLLMLEPNVFADERGYFFESWQQERYEKYGIPPLVQDNVSYSKHGSLRGLHYQLPHSQGKLIWVSHGTVWDIVVDIRRNSPTFRQWFSYSLSDKNHKQLYIPPGFAHGFCVTSEEAIFHYKCTDYYAPGCEHGVAWDDPQLNIPWPVKNPIISPKDTQFPNLDDIPHEQLFT